MPSPGPSKHEFKKSALALRTFLSGGFATKQWPHLTLFETREPTPNQTHRGHVGPAAGPIWGSRPNWDVHNGVLSASARTPLPASIPSQLSVPGPQEPSMWNLQLGGPPLNISQLRSLLPPPTQATPWFTWQPQRSSRWFLSSAFHPPTHSPPRARELLLKLKSGGETPAENPPASPHGTENQVRTPGCTV